MTWAWDLWDRFHDAAFWWMGAMVAIWLIFTIMLFILKPVFLHRWFYCAGSGSAGIDVPHHHRAALVSAREQPDHHLRRGRRKPRHDVLT